MATPLFATAVLGKGVTWTNSDAANTKKDITAAATGNGMLIASISAVLDDTTARLVQLFLNDGTTDFLVGSSNVPIGSGTDGVNPAVNLLANTSMLPWVASDGSFAIPSGWKVRAQQTTQVTAAKTLTLVAMGGSL